MTEPMRVIQVGDHDPEWTGDFFRGTSFAVGEIELCLQQLAGALVMLKQGNAVGSAVQQKLASEQISRAAGQTKAMADMLARVSISHINRRAR